MYRDELLALIDKARNPALEESRRLREQANPGIARELAREAAATRRFAQSHFASDIGAAREAHFAGLRAAQALATPEPMQSLIDASSLATLSHSLAEDLVSGHSRRLIDEASAIALNARGRVNSDVLDLLDHGRVIREMTRQFDVALAGYDALALPIETDAIHGVLLGVDTWAAIERDFSQIRQAAHGFEQMQQLSQAWADNIGSVLDTEEQLRHLAQAGTEFLDRPWLQSYLRFEQIVADALWSSGASYDENADSGGELAPTVPAGVDPNDFEANTLDTSVELSVRQVATHLGLAYFRLDTRFKAIAARLDPVATGGTATWERMVFAIGHASPRFAPELMALTYPLLCCFCLMLAPAGNVTGGGDEAHIAKDLVTFGSLVAAMLNLLDAIERTLPH